MLRHDRLRLIEAAPDIAHAGHFLMGDEAENFQPNGVTDRLILLRIGKQLLFITWLGLISII
jgi:hypothetical protein